MHKDGRISHRPDPPSCLIKITASCDERAGFNLLHGLIKKREKKRPGQQALKSRVVRRVEQRRKSDQAHRNWPPSSEPLTLEQSDGCTANAGSAPTPSDAEGK